METFALMGLLVGVAAAVYTGLAYRERVAASGTRSAPLPWPGRTGERRARALAWGFLGGLALGLGSLGLLLVY